MKPIDMLRRELHAFCELAQRRGWKLTPGVWREDDTKECCALAAVGVVTGQRNSYDQFMESSQYTPIWKAFDGSPLLPEWEGPYAELGRELRARYANKDPR
jgi:hypothetical protein